MMTRTVRRRRCTGRNKYGEQCGNHLYWEEPEESGSRAGEAPQPLCHVHRERLGDERPRCTATTAAGERCRKRAMIDALPEGQAAQTAAQVAAQVAAAEEQLCAVHRGLAKPASGDRRRCTAVRQDGQQCTRWGLRPTAEDDRDQPPLCYTHRGKRMVPKGDDRRCRAMIKEGKRCRHWATRASRRAGKPRCNHHAGPPILPAEDEERRCTALTDSGRRCRKWAMRDSDPPLCATHKHGVQRSIPDAADYEAGRACSATTRSGRRCRNWALSHTAPPLCYLHAYPEVAPSLRHGFYRHVPKLTAAERASLAGLVTEGEPLAAEIVLLRLKIRAVLAYLEQPDLPLARRLAAHRLLVRAVRTVGRLFKAQQALQAAESGNAPSVVLEGLAPRTGGALAVFLATLAEEDAPDSPPEDEEE